MRKTDHNPAILDLRVEAYKLNELMRFDGACPTEGHRLREMSLEVAADLLEMHDQGGISLDNWVSARSLVEELIHSRILENGV